MNSCKTIAILSLLSFLAACGGPGADATVPQAEPAAASSVDIGDHIVHFSALSTDQLPPEVARTYNIVRSKDRAMLNVSVLEEGTNKAVTAEVTVKTVNLTGHQPTREARQRIERFSHIFNKYRKNKEAAYGELVRNYGDSYFFYRIYGISGVSK